MHGIRSFGRHIGTEPSAVSARDLHEGGNLEKGFVSGLKQTARASLSRRFYPVHLETPTEQTRVAGLLSINWYGNKYLSNERICQWYITKRAFSNGAQASGSLTDKNIINVSYFNTSYLLKLLNKRSDFIWKSEQTRTKTNLIYRKMKGRQRWRTKKWQ